MQDILRMFPFYSLAAGAAVTDPLIQE